MRRSGRCRCPRSRLPTAQLTIEDRTAAPLSRFRSSVDDLDVKAAVEYAPVHYSVELEHVSFRGSVARTRRCRNLTGKIAIRDDNLYLQRRLVPDGRDVTDDRRRRSSGI